MFLRRAKAGAVRKARNSADIQLPVCTASSQSSRELDGYLVLPMSMQDWPAQWHISRPCSAGPPKFGLLVIAGGIRTCDYPVLAEQTQEPLFEWADRRALSPSDLLGGLMGMQEARPLQGEIKVQNVLSARTAGLACLRC